MCRWLLLVVALVPLIFSSCENSEVNFDNLLGFSSDTIFFDTVFTSTGSVTKDFRVINNLNNKITIDRIYLAGGTSSPFRINIDGESGTGKNNVVIYPRDSIYIFVDVIINPLDSDTPVFITDSIIFETGGLTFRVILQAWGQDVIIASNKITGNVTWDSPRPYIVTGESIVDSSGTLKISEGVRILFRKNSSLVVEGNLIAGGSVVKPILFASVRTEEGYRDVPGLWNGIFFISGSTGNIIRYAEIRNSTFGIQMGDPGKITGYSCPALQLESVKILHSSLNCLAVYQGNLTAVNSVFAHCGKNCININSGGEYQFIHCTVFNFWEYGIRLTPAFKVTPVSNIACTINETVLRVINSVIYGDLPSEILIGSDVSSVDVDYLFDHCLLKTDLSSATSGQAGKLPGSVFNKNPQFIDVADYDFRPDTLSVLVNAGNISLVDVYPADIRGVSRLTDRLPDIGAYERAPGEKKKTK